MELVTTEFKEYTTLDIEYPTDNNFLFFWGYGKHLPYAYLSQWYERPFFYKDIIYRSAEHFMMAEKARLFNDEASLHLILKSTHPAEAKRLGRNVSNFNIEDWNKYAFDIVTVGNILKFRDEDLKTLLLSTASSLLVEASPYDKIWGIGLAEGNRRALNKDTWLGDNLLGYALTKVRELYRLGKL